MCRAMLLPALINIIEQWSLSLRTSDSVSEERCVNQHTWYNMAWLGECFELTLGIWKREGTMKGSSVISHVNHSLKNEQEFARQICLQRWGNKLLLFIYLFGYWEFNSLSRVCQGGVAPLNCIPSPGNAILVEGSNTQPWNNYIFKSSANGSEQLGHSVCVLA